jgi:uncharacterized membrane protein YsdA (DUF1294 family)
MMQRLILLWYVIINLALFVLMGVDKYKAKHKMWRIPEATLLTLSLIGGFFGGYAGMYLFHHKFRKWYFHAVFIFSIIVHVILILKFVI